MPRGIRPHIPDHALLRRIGEGSYGEVWLARNVMGSFRAVKVVYREHFDSDRPYEREFTGIQKFEPLSRSHVGFMDLLQVGRDDQAGYFYCIMELADAAEPGSESEDAAWPGRALEPRAGGRAPAGKAGERTPPAPGTSDPEGGRRPDLSDADPGMAEYAARPDPPASPAGFDPASYRPQTLATVLKRWGRLPIEQCVQLGLSLGDALGQLHRAGLVHRDVKPSNVIFVNGVAKLADIGLVASVSAARSFVGTEGYIPPEGPGSGPADLFSLGKVLYECATGRDRHDFPELPARFGSEAEWQALLELNAVWLRACQNEPSRRYREAGGLLADLRLLQAGKSVQHLRRVERRVRTLTRVGVGLGVAAVLTVAAYLFQARQVRLLERLTDAQTRAKHQTEEHLYLHLVRNAQAHWEAGDPLQADRVLESCPAALRSWEWHYLKRQCRAPCEVLNGSEREIHEVAASPDGRWLAASEKGGHLALWDLSLKPPQRVWNRPAAAAETPFDVLPPRGTLAFSHDGRSLACVQPLAGQGWKLGWVSIDTSHTWRELVPAGEPDRRPLCLAFRPDDQAVLMGHADGTVRAYELANGREVARHPILAAAFSPDGARMASMGVARLNWPELPQPARELRVYETATGREFFAFRNFLEAPALLSLVFSPDGQRVAAGFVEMRSSSEKSQTQTHIGAARGRVLVWDLPTSREILRQDLSQKGPVDLEFSPDGRRLAVAGASLGWLVPTGQGDTQPVHLPTPAEVMIWDVPTGQELAPLRGHRHDVTSLAFLDAGRRLASASSDRTIRLWELGAPTLVPLGGLPTVPASRPPDAPPLSADGRLLAVRTLDWTVNVLDVFTGDSVAAPRMLEDDRSEAFALAGSPPGLACLSDSALRFWDLEGGREAWSIGTTNLGFVARRLACSPDGRRVALASEPELRPAEAAVLEAGTGRVLLRAQARGLGAFDFSPDGHRFALGDLEGSVRVWDVEPGVEIFSARAPGSNDATAGEGGGAASRAPGSSDGFGTAPITALTLGRGGTTLVTAEGLLTSELRLWDLPTRSLRWAASIPTSARAVALSPDGRRLAVACGRFPGSPADLLIGDAASGQTLLRLAADVERAAFSADGTRLWAVTSTRALRFWDATAWPDPAPPPPVALRRGLVEDLDERVEARLSLRAVVRQTDPDLTGRLVFPPGGAGLAVACADGSVRLLRLPGGEVASTLRGLEGDIESLACGGSGASIYIGTSAGALYRWQGGAEPATRIPTGGSGPVAALAVAPDASRAAWVRGPSPGARGEIPQAPPGVLVELPTGRQTLACPLEGLGGFQVVSFAGDGRTFATAQNRAVHLLDAASGRLARELTPALSPVAVQLSRDGRRCFVGCAPSHIDVLEVSGGESVQRLRGHTSWVVALALSPDENWLASGATDSTARLWDLAAGQEFGRIRFGRDRGARVKSVAFSPDGRWLAAGVQGEFVVVDVPPSTPPPEP